MHAFNCVVSEERIQPSHVLEMQKCPNDSVISVLCCKLKVVDMHNVSNAKLSL